VEIVCTDRTFKVIALARSVANARHADDITTQDILYGLVMEGSGIAANLLRKMAVNLTGPLRIKWTHDKARAELASLRGEAKDLLQRAETEAWECRKRWPKNDPPFAWIGTEHILLAITTGNNETGTQRLQQELNDVGCSMQELREEILQLILGPKAVS
jgi:ATP-dependent Clp protease ATP-binding subunit ClpC